MASYGLEAKVMSKGSVIGYLVVEANGVRTLLSKNSFYKLVSKNLVTNWSIVTDEDKEQHLYSESLSLKDIPNTVRDPIEIISIDSIVYKDDVIAGVVCTDANGVRHNYSIERVWDMAKMGIIKGLKGYKHDNSRVVLADEIELASIPKESIQA